MGTQLQFNAKWTRCLALVMSILYLANPLYRPLNLVFHQLLNAFESPNKIIGHETNFIEDTVFEGSSHDHKTMHLESGHNIIDFVAQVFEASNEEESSDETLQEIVKIDKHITYFEFKLRPIKKNIFLSTFWLPEQKSNKGHPIKSKEPPRLI